MEPTTPLPFYTSATGLTLLEDPLLNKGSAFSEEERSTFNLNGLLPEAKESLTEQVVRSYQQFCTIKGRLEQHIYLRNLQDTNETLFYSLLQHHLAEMMPIVYTPTVGSACQHFSQIYRRHRGLFISYPNRHRIREILRNVARRKIKVIVVTDGERILGLGDQGAGGMGIPIGKLSLYTICGGLNPAYALPIMLDVGTNNQELLDDPMYLGWRHPRIRGADYYSFVEEFVQAVKHFWPNMLLQFEDFAQHNALELLNIYQERLCCFNDDIQGTAAVTLGCLTAATRITGAKISHQRVVFAGSGSAGCGIAKLIIEQMMEEGLTEVQAQERIFMVGSKGLVTDQQSDLSEIKRQLAQKASNLAGWRKAGENFSLLEVVQQAKPTILIGVSARPNMFTEEMVRTMHSNCPRPVIMPLSNPSSHAEALPEDIMRWTDGAALIATGSPFEPVELNSNIYPIAQCNNSYIFPGLGLGILASRAKMVTQSMLMAASRALAEEALMEDGGSTHAILPPLESIPKVSRTIGFSVAKEAIKAGVAEAISDEELVERIEGNFWQPAYRNYRYSSL